MRTAAPCAFSGYGPACEKPSDAAVAMHHPVLDLIELASRPRCGPGPARERRPVIGVHQPAPVIEMVADLVILVAKNLFENRIDVDLAGRQVPVPDADATGRRRAPVAIVSVHGVRADVRRRDRCGNRRHQRDIVEWLDHVGDIDRARDVSSLGIGVAGDEDDGSRESPYAEPFAAARGRSNREGAASTIRQSTATVPPRMPRPTRTLARRGPDSGEAGRAPCAHLRRHRRSPNSSIRFALTRA